jgi:hypothetical protein
MAESTLNRWLSEGRKRPGSPYRGFARTIDEIRQNRTRFAESIEPDVRRGAQEYLWKAIRRGSMVATKL